VSIVSKNAADLYGLALADFTAARNALSADLKKKGDSETAAAVKSLKKPPVSAWTINQLSRSHPDEVKALLDAGARLRAAQDALMGGSEPSALRDATKERRDIATELTRRAAAILEDSGTKPSRTHLDRISNTLLNSAVDDDARTELETGTLAADVDAPAGLGGTWAADAPMLDERPAKDKRAARKEADRLAAEADDAEALAAEMAQEADSARAAAERAMQASSDARRAAVEARRKADEARRHV